MTQEPDEKKEDKPIDEFLNKALDEACDLGYNKAIEDAMIIVHDHEIEDEDQLNYWLQTIVEKLKALKK